MQGKQNVASMMYIQNTNFGWPYPAQQVSRGTWEVAEMLLCRRCWDLKDRRVVQLVQRKTMSVGQQPQTQLKQAGPTKMAIRCGEGKERTAASAGRCIRPRPQKTELRRALAAGVSNREYSNISSEGTGTNLNQRDAITHTVLSPDDDAMPGRAA